MTTSRFVVLHHRVGPRLDRVDTAHCDWMFAFGSRLRTWATPPVGRFDQKFKLACTPLPDHRMEYLDYEGELSGDRGSVQRLLGGTVICTEDAAAQVALHLCWDEAGRSRAARVLIQRTAVDSDSASATKGDWSLLFEPAVPDSGL